MEQVVTTESENTITKKVTWVDQKCRRIVLSVLAKLDYGQIEIIESNQGQHQHSFYPEKHDGLSPTAKMYIHDASVYKEFIKGGGIGVAEAFIEGKWSSPDLTNLIRIFAKSQEQADQIESKTSWLNKLKNAVFHKLNRNNQSGSKKNILAHYDLGNELYTRFLDPEMMYSSAIYPDEGTSLAEAQIHKLHTICQRLDLSPSDHLLEIGTGWGGLAIFAAQHYGCQVTTTTISDAQYEYAEDRVKQLGLGDKITLLKKDYRDLEGQYDKVVSVEMIEAVGLEYLPSFFKQCNDRLKPEGKLLIQSITIADQRFDYYKNNVDFIQRYIFPGGFLPSVTSLSQHMTKHTNMVIESLDDIGLDYAKTLADWRTEFLNSWNELQTFGYDEKFKRLWLYYLAYCEGAFLERSTSAIHLVARKA
jgi:cyclopropane-fatty-acyl-phospholipid synthase